MNFLKYLVKRFWIFFFRLLIIKRIRERSSGQSNIPKIKLYKNLESKIDCPSITTATDSFDKS